MKKFIPLILTLFPSLASAAGLSLAGNPIQLRVSQVSPRTLRVDLLPLDPAGTPKPAPPSTILENIPTTEKLSVKSLDAPASVTAGNLQLSISPAPLKLTLSKSGALVQELTFSPDGSFSFHTDSPTFGLGEGRQQFDRRGFYYNFTNGQNDFLNTHGGTIPVPFLIGSDGWAFFIHNPPPAGTRNPNTPWGQFDLRGDTPAPAPARPNIQNFAAYTALLTAPDPRPTRGRYIPRADTLANSPQTIFLMALDTPSDALTEYTHLVGNPIMPPKWVLGYMQSHRSLAGPDEPLAIAKKFRDDQLPCDALIYLGTGYTNSTQPNAPFSGWNLGHGSLDFNPFIFPNPQKAIDDLHALNFKIVLHKNAAPTNLHGNSVNDPPDNNNHIAAYWTTHTALMKMGIDAWWPDDGDELPVENRLARIRAYDEGPLKDRPNERPWSLNRNGYAGVAKYGGWNWSGDVTSRWDTLAAHVPDGVQFSLSVSPWWGTDIGGFVTSAEYSGELYTRWFQFAAFCPLFRSHGRNWHLHTPFGWDTGETGPIESRPAPPASELHNAAVEPACKKALELRYQLLPYNYTITREACDTGMPLMRALLLAYPKDPTAVSLGDEYLWGPSLLVAPVVEKAATTRKVYLPDGSDWYDFATLQKLPGKQWIQKPVALDTIPLYVKAGTILPWDPIRQFTAEPTSDPTTLRIFPGKDASFILYDDDGHSQLYTTDKDPQTQWIKMTWTDATKTVTLDPDPRMKSWPANFQRSFKIQLATDPNTTKQITFTGTHTETKF